MEQEQEQELTEAEVRAGILEAVDIIGMADDGTAYLASLLAQGILTLEGGQEAEKAEADGD